MKGKIPYTALKDINFSIEKGDLSPLWGRPAAVKARF